MSGPKGVMVAPLAPALIPAIVIAGVVAAGTVALVKFAEHYLEQKRLAERLKQHQEDLAELVARLREMGEDAGALQSDAQQAVQKARELADAGKAEEAVIFLNRELTDLGICATKLRGRIEERAARLQRQQRKLRASLATFEQVRGELRRGSEAAISADWPEADQRRLREHLESALQAIQAPAPPSESLKQNADRELDDAATALAGAQSRLAELHRAFEEELRRTRSRQLADKLGTAEFKAIKLDDFLAEQARREQEAARREDAVLEKLDALLAKIALLHDTAGWAQLAHRANEIRAEEDARRRQLLYENLVLETGRRLRELRAVEAWTIEVDQLLEQSAPYAGTAVDEIVRELRELRRAGRVVALDNLRQRLEQTRKSELERLERERKRRAILASLQELGYETSEGMETALVQAGKLIVRKPDHGEYVVEVVANQDLSLLQTAMVRYAESEELTAQQRQRDLETEEAWCADHAELRRKMAEHGLTTSFKLQLPAGAHPVRIVKRSERGREASAKIVRRQASS